MKIKPYNKNISIADIENLKEAELHLEINRVKILGRIFYIYKTIASCFRIGRASWDMDEDEIRNWDMFNLYDGADNSVYSTFEYPLPETNIRCIALIKDKNQKVEFDFSDGQFPQRWVFENFEDELKNGIKEYQDKLKKELEEEKETQEKINRAKRNRKIVIANVKKKLTPEEIEVVFG